MAVLACGELVTDARGQELAEHGSSLFPVACYNDHISERPVPWHWHPELEAVVVTAGAVRVAVNGEAHVLKAGEGAFINGEALHACLSAGSGECILRSVVFHPRLVGGGVDSILWQKYVEPLTADPSLACVCLRGTAAWEREAVEAISLCWTLCAEEKAGFEFEARDRLSRLIFLLAQNCPPAEKTPGEKALRDGERIKTMLHYIQGHYSGRVTLADIARSANLSENECLRCFHSTIGSTPIRYLQELRIQRAAELLAATGRKVSDIGAACGFQEMSYFAKLFREKKGCTPAAYRRTRREGGQ